MVFMCIYTTLCIHMGYCCYYWEKEDTLIEVDIDYCCYIRWLVTRHGSQYRM